MDRGSETSLLSQIVGNQVFHARALTESAHGNAVQGSRGTVEVGLGERRRLRREFHFLSISTRVIFNPDK